MVTIKLVGIGNATSLHTSTQMGKNGQAASNGPFWQFLCVESPMCIPNARNLSNIPKRTQYDNMHLGSH